MSEKNMGRLAQDMKREIIAIISRLKDPRYVSVLGNPDGPAPVIEALNRASGHVRTEISRKMHIRKAPRLVFVEDDGAAYAAHINELLKELNVDGQEAAPSENDGE